MILNVGIISFVWSFGFIDRIAEDSDRKQDEGEWHTAKGPGLGVEPRTAAVRTKPVYMGRCSTNWAKQHPRNYFFFFV